MGEEFEVVTVGVVEGVEVLAVDVEDSDYLVVVFDGDNDFGATGTTAGDMTWELVNIWHDDGLSLLPGGATDAFALAYAGASEWALEGSEYELVVENTIEACPPETKCLVEASCYVCHCGYGV